VLEACCCIPAALGPSPTPNSGVVVLRNRAEVGWKGHGFHALRKKGPETKLAHGYL
jgi:hypothetical protein